MLRGFHAREGVFFGSPNGVFDLKDLSKRQWGVTAPREIRAETHITTQAVRGNGMCGPGYSARRSMQYRIYRVCPINEGSWKSSAMVYRG